MSEQEKPITVETVELHQGTRYDVPDGLISVRFDSVDFHSQGHGAKVPRVRLEVTREATADEIDRRAAAAAVAEVDERNEAAIREEVRRYERELREGAATLTRKLAEPKSEAMTLVDDQRELTPER